MLLSPGSTANKARVEDCSIYGQNHEVRYLLISKTARGDILDNALVY